MFPFSQLKVSQILFQTEYMIYLIYGLLLSTNFTTKFRLIFVLKVTSPTKKILFAIKQPLMRFFFYLKKKFEFFHLKKKFRSRDIQIFVFLRNSQISKSVTSSKTLLHNASYTFVYFFPILSTTKMKLGQILQCIL